MAYLNDDVRSPVPDIEKIQSDIKRLKDFIAYKVNHSDEERDQYRPQGSGGQTPIKRNKNQFSDNETNIDDSQQVLPYDRTDKLYDKNYEDLGPNFNSNYSQMQVMELKADVAQTKAELDDSRSKLERSEAEAANFIGRIGKLNIITALLNLQLLYFLFAYLYIYSFYLLLLSPRSKNIIILTIFLIFIFIILISII